MPGPSQPPRSEEHTSELQSRFDLVCRLLLEKKNILSYTPLCGQRNQFCHNHAYIANCFLITVFLYLPPVDVFAKANFAEFEIFFFFNDTAPTEIYTLSLHDALPISPTRRASAASSAAISAVAPAMSASSW